MNMDGMMDLGTDTAAMAAMEVGVSGATSIMVEDSAMNVVTYLDSLEKLAAAGALESITLTDGGTPTLTLTATQLAQDAVAIGHILVPFTFTVPGVPDYVSGYVFQQDAAGRNQSGIPLVYSAPAPAGGDTVVGFQATARLGSGHDTILLPGPRSEYAVEVDSGGQTLIKDLSATSATAGMSMIASGESYIVFDISALTATDNGAISYSGMYFVLSGADAQIADIYNAAFAREPDMPGLEYWETVFRAGTLDLNGIAQQFLVSSEFALNFPAASAPVDRGGPNDAAFLNALYQNILGRSADTAGEAYWLAQLASGAVTRAQVLADFAISPENQHIVSAQDGGWQINPAQGGYADTGALLPAETVLVQAAANNYLDAALIDSNTIGAGVTAGPYSLSSGGQLTVAATAPAQTILLGGKVQNLVVDNNGDTIYGALHGGGITLDGLGDYVDLTNANGDAVIFGASALNDTVNLSMGRGTTITGFLPGHGSSLQVTSTNIAADISVLDGSAAAISGSNLQFGGSMAYVVRTGSLGVGSSASVLQAINAAYIPAGKINESVIFIGNDNIGQTEIWAYNPYTPEHTITATDILLVGNLAGVNAMSLTPADFV